MYAFDGNCIFLKLPVVSNGRDVKSFALIRNVINREEVYISYGAPYLMVLTSRM